MANKWAIANGNYSNTSTWNDNTLPQEGDIVYCNGFTITYTNEDVPNMVFSKLSNRICPDTGISGGHFVNSSNQNIDTVYNFDIEGLENTNYNDYVIRVGYGCSTTFNGECNGCYPVFFDITTIDGSRKIIFNKKYTGGFVKDSNNDAACVNIILNLGYDSGTSPVFFAFYRGNWHMTNGCFIRCYGDFHYRCTSFTTNTNSFFNLTLENAYIYTPISFVPSGTYITRQVVTVENYYQLGGFFSTSFFMQFKENSFIQQNNGVKLYGEGLLHYPEEDDVKLDVEYGMYGELRGRYAPTVLTEEQIQRIANCATVSTVQQCFEDFKEE